MMVSLNKVMSLFFKYQYQLILIGAILLCLYPLSLFIYIPKWDNINAFLPYRYFISDNLWNGHLPLWNPFQNLGVPAYSDLQSGCWNPIVWGLMLFGKYTIKSLIVELLLCHIIGGIGMYALSFDYFNCKKTSFILGFSYALSGFMVGSSQLLVFLVAVAWFPWVTFGLLKFFKTYSIKYQLLSAFFLAMFISGASPAYTIILGYIVCGMFLYHIVSHRKNPSNAKKIITGGFTILTVLILLLAPYINSFIEFSPYFNRIEKLSYGKYLLDNPFTPISYLSFLFPFSVIAKTDWFNITDLSLRNGYFGLVGLIGLFSSLFSKFDSKKTILLIGLIASLILAAGDETFLFKYFYSLPGFGVFRHPSIFRAFTIFCALLLAGDEIKSAISTGIKKHHLWIGGIFLIIVLVSGAYSFSKSSFSDILLLTNNSLAYLELSESSLFTHLVLNVFIVLAVLCVSFLLKKVFHLSLFVTLCIFVILDFGLQTRLSIPTTVCYNVKQKDVASFFEELPSNINQKDNYTPLALLNEKQGLKRTKGIWQNLSTYSKTLSYVGINPLRFKEFDIAKDNGKLEHVLKGNILHFENEEKSSVKDILIDYNKFSGKIYNHKNEELQLILVQNYHHLWGAKINGNPLVVKPFNGFAMSVKVPGNTFGIIEFEYKSPKTIYLFIISLVSYILLLFYLLKVNFSLR